MKLPDVSLGHLQVFRASVDVVHDMQHNMPAIVVELQVRNVRNDGLAKVSGRTIIHHTEARDPETFRLLLRQVVVDAFVHEIDEWLRVDGRLVTNPHP